jgi:cytochrome c oxidase subunit I+III
VSAATAPAAPSAASALERAWRTPPGLGGWLSAVNHKQIGARFVVTGFAFLLIGGVLALLIRTQLAQPGAEVLGPETYNQVFTMHGTTMMFLFALPVVEGFAMYLLPLMLGTRDLPFPRLNAFGYWCLLFGGVFLTSSWIFGLAPDGGWFNYPPLTGPEFSPGNRIDFWLLGVSFVEIATILGAIELAVLILRQRAPGMAIHRMPIFAWSILVTAAMIILAFPPLVAASVMLELDRLIGTQFFHAAAGGDPLLWQHLFWIFGHPEVYVMFLPAAGIVSLIVPTFARRPLAGYAFVVAATVAVGFLSMGLWVHHMFTVGLPFLSLGFFAGASMAITIPNGVQVVAWIATLWRGAIVWSTPLLFVVGFIAIFVVGGITGVMLAAVPFDWQVHDSFFVVAHFHYVLIGGVVFPVFAGLHYWLPKATGRMLGDGLGRLTFWLMFVGFNVAFLPQHWLGLWGMPRRVYTYRDDVGWGFWNLVSTIGAYLLAAGVLVFVVNVVRSARCGRPAGDNPWGAGTLEWATSSPPAPYNVATIPHVGSREPLWEAGGAATATGQRPLPPAGLLAGDPRGRREVVHTTVLDGRPEAVVRLTAGSYAPLVAAAGLVPLFAGLLVKQPALALAGVAVTVAALVAWAWPRGEKQPVGAQAAPSEDEASRDGLPVEERAGRPVAGVAVLLGAAVLASFQLSVIASYVYLRYGVRAWPPEGLPLLDLLLPGAAAALLVVSLPAAVLAAWASRTARSRSLALALGALVVIGGASVALVVADLLRAPFAPGAHAYASLHHLLLGAQAAFAAAGVLAVAVLLARSLAGHFRAGSHSGPRLVALYWGFVAVSGLLTLATVHLGGRVL